MGFFKTSISQKIKEVASLFLKIDTQKDIDYKIDEIRNKCYINCSKHYWINLLLNDLSKKDLIVVEDLKKEDIIDGVITCFCIYENEDEKIEGAKNISSVDQLNKEIKRLKF